MTVTPHTPHGAQPAADGAPRRSLILAGGGMRVAYQAGVIRALIESGLTFTHADGTSGGTMNLAMLLSGLSPEDMCDRWRTLNVKDFASLLPLEDYLKATDLIAMGSADGLTGKVFPHLGIDVPTINAATGMAGTFNVCNYTRKTNEAVPHDRVDLDLLVAGVSLPIFMPPVQRGGELYVDSVWIKDANLMEAVRRGADELWLVWCIGNSAQYLRGMFHQYVHMIELSANGGLFEEFDRINDINARIRNGEAVGGRTQPIRLHLIKPEYPLPLDPEFYFGRIDAATLIAMGYADAKQYLAHLNPAGIAFVPEATRMKDNVLGLAFRERLSGHFAWGETDPQVAVQQAAAAGSTLALEMAVSIDDLQRFLSEPGHAGRLTGYISLAPAGADIPAKSGTFRLASPPDSPHRRVITYDLAFDWQGKEYYLAGEKEIDDHPGFDVWADTATLYVQLHAGVDRSAPVVGAGVAKLSIGELLKMLASLHAINAPSAGQSVAAVVEFGRCYLGALWATYGSHVARDTADAASPLA